MMEFTKEEKIRLLVAKKFFTTDTANGKLPEVIMSDGPAGIRRGLVECPEGKPYICYPASHVLANSWDRAVAKKVGEALAGDCAEENIDVILAPGVNIKRTPLCGRNFEYWSEDPYLAGTLATEYIKGCQENGVGTCLKHFCANNREYDRVSQSSELDERTLREIYARPFEIVLENVSPYAVMVSYNPVNGINMSENAWALRGILRGDLGYDGIVLSDWGSVRNRAEALKASLDLMFPFEQRGLEDLKTAYEQGTITDEDIDESVDRILKLIARVEENKKLRKKLSVEERRGISLEAAQKSMVLLKNEDNILPLKAEKIAVLGGMSACVGGGSAQTVLKYPPRPLAKELVERLPETEVTSHGLFSHSSCVKSPAGIRVSKVKDVLGLAYDADITVLVVGHSEIIETESYDRSSIKLPEVLEDLILKIADKTDRLVIVLETGSAVDVSAWIDKVQAVLYTGFAGEAINQAIADILVGRVCPSGRLSETFPLRLEDTPTGSERGNGYSERYKEGVLVGYRHYDTKKIPVRFPFGFGLSYAKFEYSNFSVKEKGLYEYEVSFNVKNVSDIEGGEVAQLYVRNVDECVERPTKELRGFEKVYLRAGEEKRISFTTDKSSFAYFSICHKDWFVSPGRYELLVCRDVNTIEFTKKIIIK